MTLLTALWFRFSTTAAIVRLPVTTPSGVEYVYAGVLIVLYAFQLRVAGSTNKKCITPQGRASVLRTLLKNSKRAGATTTESQLKAARAPTTFLLNYVQMNLRSSCPCARYHETAIIYC